MGMVNDTNWQLLLVITFQRCWFVKRHGLIKSRVNLCTTTILNLVAIVDMGSLLMGSFVSKIESWTTKCWSL